MNSMPTVGWIGLGKMGAPMATRLREAGYPLHVYDVATEACDPLRDAGATVMRNAHAVAEAADVVFTSLPNDAVLRSLLIAPGGIAPQLTAGKLLVETSTVSPAASAEAGRALAAGAGYLRSPISGSTALAASGKLTVLASGVRADYDRVQPMMAHFASRFFYVGAGEEARTLKLVINMLVGATSALLAEALTFGEKGGLEVGQMLGVIAESVVNSPLIAYKRGMMEQRDYTAAFTIEQMIKDFDLILDAARDTTVPVYLTALIRQQYGAASAQGLGSQDFFSLLQQYESQAGFPQLQVPQTS